MSIELIQAGSYTTIQDKGRVRLAHFGVPLSGFMDEHSANLANWLVGNQPGSGLLEMTWTGVELISHTTCSVALAGAEFECFVNDQPINTDNTIQLQTDDHFKMGRLLTGVRAYLAFAGSFDVTVHGGSMSTLSVAKLGGHSGRALKAGDVLNLKQPSLVAVKHKPSWKKVMPQSVHVLRAMPGPEIGYFTPNSIRQALGQAYQITHDSNRQGFRLSADPIPAPKSFSMSSSGLVAGSLQVTPDGQTILAMKDAQTTGGYPRILVVNQDQISQLAQIRPGEDIYFFVTSE